MSVKISTPCLKRVFFLVKVAGVVLKDWLLVQEKKF